MTDERTPHGESWAGKLSPDGWANAALRVPGSREPAFWGVSVRVETVDGRPEITGLRIEQASDRVAVVTADRLRRLPLRMLREVASVISEGARSTDGRASADAVSDAYLGTRIERAPGEPWPRAHYEFIAQAYRHAVQRGLPPLLEIQRMWGVSRAMASKYVAKARELGLLGYPARPGVAGADATTSPIAGQTQTPVRKKSQTKRRKPR